MKTKIVKYKQGKPVKWEAQVRGMLLTIRLRRPELGEKTTIVRDVCTRKSPRNQERLWRALGGKRPKQPRRTRLMSRAEARTIVFAVG